MPYKDPRKQVEAHKKWAALHPEAQKEYEKSRDVKKKRTQMKVWRTANPARCRYNKQAEKSRNPEAFKSKCKDRALKRAYGISYCDYLSMLSKQGGTCAICRRIPDEETLFVDHSHSTGLIRGLLCKSCNTGIGFFKEDVESLGRAIRYLWAAL